MEPRLTNKEMEEQLNKALASQFRLITAQAFLIESYGSSWWEILCINRMGGRQANK